MSSKKKRKSRSNEVSQINIPISLDENDCVLNQQNVLCCTESLKRFIESGGETHFEFIQYLYECWKDTGDLPLLDDNEATILNELHQIWTERKKKEKEQEKESTMSIGPQVYELSTVSAIKLLIKNVSTHKQYNDNLITFIYNLEILIKTSEPTRSLAYDIMQIMFSNIFIKRSYVDLEKEANKGLNPNYFVVLGLLYDSEVMSNASLQYPPSSDQASIVNGTSASSNNNKKNANILNTHASVKYYMRAYKNNSNHSIASMLLGNIYYSNVHIRNYTLAYQWYMISAKLNNPLAQHKIGYFFDEGLNEVCDINIMEAMKWYIKASELLSDSMHNLAKIYEDGRGNISRDITLAISLYSIAAARGFTLSQVNLGRLYLLGDYSFILDKEAGKRLLTLAAESGDNDAQMVIGMMHATPAFQCYNLQLSEYWLKLSLASGNVESERLLKRVTKQMSIMNLPFLQSLTYISPNQGSAGGRSDTFGTVIHRHYNDSSYHYIMNKEKFHILANYIPDGNYSISGNGKRLLFSHQSKIDKRRTSMLYSQYMQNNAIQQSLSSSSPSSMSDNQNIDNAITNPNIDENQSRSYSNGNSSRDSNRDKDASNILILNSHSAHSAMLRGFDYLKHFLYHAAILEFTKAFDLDRTKLIYFIFRLFTLCIISHWEDCLHDSEYLLSLIDNNGFETQGVRSGTVNTVHAVHGDADLKGNHCIPSDPSQTLNANTNAGVSQTSSASASCNASPHFSTSYIQLPIQDVEYFRMGIVYLTIPNPLYTTGNNNENGNGNGASTNTSDNDGDENSENENNVKSILYRKGFTNAKWNMIHLYKILSCCLECILSDKFSFMIYKATVNTPLRTEHGGGSSKGISPTVTASTSMSSHIASSMNAFHPITSHIDNNNKLLYDDDNGKVEEILKFMHKISKTHANELVKVLCSNCMEYDIRCVRSIILLDSLTKNSITCTDHFIHNGGIPIVLQLLQGNFLQVPSGMTKLIPSKRKTETKQQKEKERKEAKDEYIGNESDKGIIIANREKEERYVDKAENEGIVDAENEAETDTTNKPFDIISFISRNTFKATDMMQWSEFIDENGHLDVRELEQAHQEASNDATVPPIAAVSSSIDADKISVESATASVGADVTGIGDNASASTRALSAEEQRRQQQEDILNKQSSLKFCSPVNLRNANFNRDEITDTLWWHCSNILRNLTSRQNDRVDEIGNTVTRSVQRTKVVSNVIHASDGTELYLKNTLRCLLSIYELDESVDESTTCPAASMTSNTSTTMSNKYIPRNGNVTLPNDSGTALCTIENASDGTLKTDRTVVVMAPETKDTTNNDSNKSDKCEVDESTTTSQKEQSNESKGNKDVEIGQANLPPVRTLYQEKEEINNLKWKINFDVSHHKVKIALANLQVLSGLSSHYGDEFAPDHNPIAVYVYANDDDNQNMGSEGDFKRDQFKAGDLTSIEPITDENTKMESDDSDDTKTLKSLPLATTTNNNTGNNNSGSLTDNSTKRTNIINKKKQEIDKQYKQFWKVLVTNNIEQVIIHTIHLCHVVAKYLTFKKIENEVHHKENEATPNQSLKNRGLYYQVVNSECLLLLVYATHSLSTLFVHTPLNVLLSVAKTNNIIKILYNLYFFNTKAGRQIYISRHNTLDEITQNSVFGDPKVGNGIIDSTGIERASSNIDWDVIKLYLPNEHDEVGASVGVGGGAGGAGSETSLSGEGNINKSASNAMSTVKPVTSGISTVLADKKKKPNELQALSQTGQKSSKLKLKLKVEEEDDGVMQINALKEEINSLRILREMLSKENDLELATIADKLNINLEGIHSKKLEEQSATLELEIRLKVLFVLCRLMYVLNPQTITATGHELHDTAMKRFVVTEGLEILDKVCHEDKSKSDK